MKGRRFREREEVRTESDQKKRVDAMLQSLKTEREKRKMELRKVGSHWKLEKRKWILL